MESDQELASRAAGGDRLAFRDLVERYQTAIYGYAFQLTRDRHAARRLAREALVRAFVEAQSLTDPASWLEWVLDFVVDLNRQRRMRSSSIVDKEGEPVHKAAPSALSDKVMLLIADDVHSIDASDRLVLTLKYGAGYDPEQIGAAIGESAATVSTRVTHGFKALRDLLLERVRAGEVPLGV